MIPRPRGAARAARPAAAGPPDAVAAGVRTLVTGGCVMAVGVALCLVLAPRPVVVNDGLSWFGVTRSTVVPFAGAMLVTALLLARAARELGPLPAVRPLTRALAGCAVLLPLLVATPFTLSPLVEDAHETIGSALFVLQLLAAGWLWRRTGDCVLGLLLLAMVAAGLVRAATLPDLVEGMLQAQLVFQAAFTAAAVRGVLRLGAGQREGSRNSIRLPKGSSA